MNTIVFILVLAANRLALATPIYQANIKVIGTTYGVRLSSNVSSIKNSFTFRHLILPEPIGVHQFRADIATATGPVVVGPMSEVSLANITFRSSNPFQTLHWGIGTDLSYSRVQVHQSNGNTVDAVNAPRYDTHGHGALVMILYDYEALPETAAVSGATTDKKSQHAALRHPEIEYRGSTSHSNHYLFGRSRVTRTNTTRPSAGPGTYAGITVGSSDGVSIAPSLLLTFIGLYNTIM